MSCPHCHQHAPPREPARKQEPAPHEPAAHEPTAPRDPAPHKRPSRASMILPALLLMLMPKCPICLAAYIALVTGIGIPRATAAWLRWSLIILCIAAMLWLTARWSLYLYRRLTH